MLGTRVTRLFSIRHPIVQGGMIWTAGWRLAAAVANAGGLGLIGAGSMDPPLLREQIAKARRAAPGGGWGVNLPLFYEHTDAHLQTILDEKIPIVFTSGGSPRVHTARLQRAGCRVAHVCSTPEQALKCEAAGADAVVVEGFEAGGHDGPDELATLALTRQAARACSIPVIAAGGIFDGATMAAALALGAEGVQVGTRFAASEEASCHPAFKAAIVAAGSTATRLMLRKLIPVRALTNEWARRVLDAEAAGASKEALLELLGAKRSRRGMFEGDLQEGELEIGQASGAIDAIEPAGQIVQDMARGCADAIARLEALAGAGGSQGENR